MDKIEKISTISVKFDHLGEKDVNLFRKKKRNGDSEVQTASVIYGHNGAGKSTLSRELRKFSAGEKANIKFKGIDKKEIDLEDYKRNIFVFTEDFVEENFYRVESNGLNPIILIGDKAKAQKNIEELEIKLKKIDQDISRSEESRNEKQKIIDSTAKAYKDYLRELWRERSARYNNNGQMKNFMQATQQKIESLHVSKLTLDSLNKEFEKKTKKILNSTGGEKSLWTPQNLDIKIKTKEIEAFLYSTPQNANTEEGQSDNKFSEFKISELEKKLKTTFSNSSKYCKECFQALSNEYKNQIDQEIKDYINKVNSINYLSKANELKIERIDVPKLPVEIKLEERLKVRFNDAYNAINKYIDQLNSTLSEKAEAPFTQISLKIEEEIEKLKGEVKAVNNDCKEVVEEYNLSIDQVDQLREEAEDINNKISALQSCGKRKELAKLRAELDKDFPNLDSLKEGKRLIQQKIDGIRESCNDKKLAIDFINYLLKIVFGNNSMQLSLSEEYYEVKNRSNSVSPQSLSTGEKNILALCYFITSIFKGKEILDSHGNLNIPDEPMLIIFDDPISSLDYDNKYGIISLINFFVQNLFKKNQKSKICILTHDLGTINDFRQIFSKIDSSFKYSLFNFRDGDLVEMPLSKDLYLDILKRMFEVATGSVKSIHSYISHNEIRRLWEAYSIFELGEKITEVNTSRFVKQFICRSSAKVEKFIDGFPVHAFINLDSHSEFQIRSFNLELQPVVSEDELRRFIKDILSFIHIVSPNHIISRVDKRDFCSVKEKMDSILEETLNRYSPELTVNSFSEH